MRANKKDLRIFLGLEVFAIVWAGVVFSQIHDRVWAGGLAGAYFIISALWMLRRTLKWPDRWRSACLYALLIHLFGIAIPMVVARFSHVDQPFSEIKIWGLEGPVFHQLSTYVFGALIATTAVDLWRATRKS